MNAVERDLKRIHILLDEFNFLILKRCDAETIAASQALLRMYLGKRASGVLSGVVSTDAENETGVENV